MNLIDFISANRESLYALLDLVPAPVFYKDINGRYMGCNSSFEAFLGISRNDLIGKDVFEILPSKEEARVFYEKDQELFQDPGDQVYTADLTPVVGKPCVVRFHKRVFFDDHGHPAGLLGVVFDVTDEAELTDHLSRLACVDELTGAMNRREGVGRLETELTSSAARRRPLSLVTLDLDHFKGVNDTWGHAQGDLVLSSTAKLVENLLREPDFLFRFGGEEFMICLPNTRKPQALMVAERIRGAVAGHRLRTRGGQTHGLTASFGVATFPDDGATGETLMFQSDSAMYRAKRNGRNRVEAAGGADG